MAVGDVFTAAVASIASGGMGVLHPGGCTVFMALCAPGDTVSGRIIAEHGGWAEAELLDVHEASSVRVEALCPLYGVCGGCSLQHIRYDAQLAIKGALLVEAFRRIGACSPSVRAEAGNPWEYRNRVSFHVYRPDGEFRVRGFRPGFKARRSAAVVPLSDCPAADPLIRASLREGGLEIPPGKNRFTVYAKDGALFSEAGRNRGTIVLGGKTMTLEASSFFQSNAFMLEKLLPVLRAAAAGAALEAGGLPMADLYAGAGTFSLFLADCFSGVDLLEKDSRALELARRNLAEAFGGTGAFRFFAQSDDGWVRSGRARNYGFAVLDPPRQGLSPSLSGWLLEKGPPVAAYVSCDASTLARDCRMLSAVYDLDQLHFFDFYPQTAHIESLAVLKRR